MRRYDIINYLIKQNDYKSYLEIGVFNPADNFRKIQANYKVGVDPNPIGAEIDEIQIMTSDEWFSFSKETFDIIFIDGLHLEDQVLKDLDNSFRALNVGGTIVVHDCLPPTEWHTRDYEQYKYDRSPWNGTVYKAFLRFALSNPALRIAVVDTDWGCGLIQNPGNKELNEITNQQITWDYFYKNRKEILRILETAEFLERYKKPMWWRFAKKVGVI